MKARDRLAVALDVATLEEARAFGASVAPHAGVLKVGLELFVAYGPRAVAELSSLGCKIFLDLKLHDIPETVARAVARARELGVAYLTVHAAGGRAMLEAASRAAEGRVKLLGVTVLTSIAPADLQGVGVTRPLPEHALELGRLCRDAGVDGLVASPHEAKLLRRELRGALIVTPGIRPGDSSHDDQARVSTPAAAIAAGADILVVGRPVRDAPDRKAAAAAVEAEIASALG